MAAGICYGAAVVLPFSPRLYLQDGSPAEGRAAADRPRATGILGEQ